MILAIKMQSIKCNSLDQKWNDHLCGVKVDFRVGFKVSFDEGTAVGVFSNGLELGSGECLTVGTTVLG